MANPVFVRRALRYGRRMWPLALAAKRHWDNMDDREKERYMRMARQYAERGRKVVESRRGRGPGGRRR